MIKTNIAVLGIAALVSACAAQAEPAPSRRTAAACENLRHYYPTDMHLVATVAGVPMLVCPAPTPAPSGPLMIEFGSNAYLGWWAKHRPERVIVPGEENGDN